MTSGKKKAGVTRERVGKLIRSWIAPSGKDDGIDVLAWTAPLGTKPPRIKVQVKRRKDSIAVDELRSFMAVLGGDDVGLFVTTGRFTKDAQDEARLQETTAIVRPRSPPSWCARAGSSTATRA